MTEDADAGGTERTTAPQSPYGLRELVVGFAVFAAGAAVAFGVPLALA